MRTRFTLMFLAAVLLFAIAVAPAMAQDAGQICVTISSHEVCGTPEQIISIIEALEGSDSASEPEPEATAEPNADEPVLTVPEYSITGAVDDVDLSNLLTVEDDETFTNETRYGTEMIFAEPGMLLVGPEFPQELIDASGGAIARVDPSNRFPMDNEDSTRLGCGEGRIVQISGNVMTLQIEDVRIELGGAPGINWHAFIRCRFSDGEQDTDAGGEIIATDYIPNRNLVSIYPVGAFLSLDALGQMLDIATGEFSCGSEGCGWQYFFMYDTNTQAYAVARYSVDTGWESLDSNWDVTVPDAVGANLGTITVSGPLSGTRPRGTKSG